MNSKLTRRLEDLESQITPQFKIVRLQLVGVDPDGKKENFGPPIEVKIPVPSQPGKRRWR